MFFKMVQTNYFLLNLLAIIMVFHTPRKGGLYL